MASLMADSLTEDMFHLAHLHQGRRCNYQGEAAGQAKKKEKIAASARRRWAYNKSPVRMGEGENLKKGASVKSGSNCLNTGGGKKKRLIIRT